MQGTSSKQVALELVLFAESLDSLISEYQEMEKSTGNEEEGEEEGEELRDSNPPIRD